MTPPPTTTTVATHATIHLRTVRFLESQPLDCATFCALAAHCSTSLLDSRSLPAGPWICACAAPPPPEPPEPPNENRRPWLSGTGFGIFQPRSIMQERHLR